MLEATMGAMLRRCNRAIRFYSRLAADLLRVAVAPCLTKQSSLQPVSIEPMGQEVLTNPSVLSDGKNVQVAVRQVNYRLRDDKRGIEQLPGSNDSRSHTWLYDWNPTYPSGLPRALKLSAPEELDLEDPRIFLWGSDIWALWTAGQLIGEMSWKNTMAMGRLTRPGTIEDIRLIESPHGRQREKNWAPFVAFEKIHFIYDFEHLEIYRLNSHFVLESVSRTKSPIRGLKDYRGSSQVIPWHEGWMCVAHRAIRVPRTLSFLPGSLYLHRFIELNKDFSLKRLSREFILERRGVEFCAGLTKHDDRYLISYGLDDSVARLAELRMSQINGLLPA